MTISGMTGFRRREGALNGWSWAIEARSVNGRNLELRCRTPPGLDSLERIAREAAQARFQRGQINLNIQAGRDESLGEARINAEALEHYLALGAPLIAAGRAAPPTLDGLLRLPGVIETGDEHQDGAARTALEAAIARDIGEALDGLKAARLEEGAALLVVINAFLDQIEALTAAAEARAIDQPALIRERFARRLIELTGAIAAEDRILQEAAVMAAKADVREEIDRLAAHAAAARTLLDQTGAAGRRLDFLTQELMREANTLCAKSAGAALTGVGLELKAVIDQMREQVQNVE